MSPTPATTSIATRDALVRSAVWWSRPTCRNGCATQRVFRADGSRIHAALLYFFRALRWISPPRRANGVTETRSIRGGVDAADLRERQGGEDHPVRRAARSAAEERSDPAKTRRQAPVRLVFTGRCVL